MTRNSAVMSRVAGKPRRALLAGPGTALRVAFAGVAICCGALAAAPPSSATSVVQVHQRPSIRSVSPARARAGKIITITGIRLDGANRVTIHGMRARFHVVSASKLTATVPATATTGRVKVTVGGASATSPQTLAIAPAVTIFDPVSGLVGTKVKVTGTGFADPCEVSFGAVAAACKANSATKITTTVPPGATSGPITVTTVGGTVTTPSSFTVTGPTVAVSPVSGPPGTPVTVTGTGFRANEEVDLYVGTTDQVLAASNGAGNISYSGLVIPASAQPGDAWVSAVGRSSGDAAQASFLVQANWPEFGLGAGGDRNNPYENTLSTSNVGSIDRDWSYATGSQIYSSPVVADGVVYVRSSDDNLYAISAATGSELWSYPTNAQTSSPAVANGLVYAASADNGLSALNAATGDLTWSFSTAQPVESSPTVANGVVYFGTGDGTVWALNATSGDVLWSYATGGGAILSSLTVADGIVFAGTATGPLDAIRATAGTLIWSTFPTGGMSSASVADGIVYVSGNDGYLFAYNATSGAYIWEYETSGNQWTSPAVADGIVYAGAGGGILDAFDAATGALLWSYTTNGPIDSSPAVANGVVYIGSEDDNLYALNAEFGGRLWSYATGASIEYSSPAIANGVVYAGSTDDSLYAFDLAGGLSENDAARTRPTISALRPDLSLPIRKRTVA
jgi:outer membrane protein assembly factor BamB